MIYYEVVEDVGDGYGATRRFQTQEEAEAYIEMVNNEGGECGCLNGVDKVDTDADDFYHKEEIE